MYRNAFIVTISALSLSLSLFGCDIATPQDGCVPCATNDCTGDGGGSSFVSSSSSTSGAGGLCGCQFDPDYTAAAAECADMREVNGTCTLVHKHDYEACRGGVGRCISGNCQPVSWNAQCEGHNDIKLDICANDAACDDGNPCTADFCPSPGCGMCAHVPVTDLRPCGPGFDGMICREGSCCDKPAGFSAP